VLRIRSLGTVPYHEAAALQHALAREAEDDYLLLLQHPPVYTLGAHADDRHVLVDPAEVGATLEHTDRDRARPHVVRSRARAPPGAVGH
jgi:lipoate-protein ligase B